MRHNAADSNTATSLSHHQLKCICCGGVIDMPPGQDLGLGLNLWLGLVSDECALVCDACTSRLIIEKQAESASSALKHAKRRSP